ncbi:hypothetical protein PFFCH_04938 [Plasmodium falciparum FCH/4]|uniref:Uncharacterized protein n=1 Tax=Plasmodium falciparum FCH/4 TaxID=1036724 RepID=A0A024VHH7_PLAFA|nr:hypothetical protein PFFCH_04938 [Plasmodium falciparum FCH/4]
MATLFWLINLSIQSTSNFGNYSFFFFFTTKKGK